MRKRIPTPVSASAVTTAVRVYLDAGSGDDSSRAEKFLTKIGFVNLHDPEAVRALSDDSCRAISGLLNTKNAPYMHAQLAEEILLRLAAANPVNSETNLASRHRTAWIWLGYAGGLAVSRLPADGEDVEQHLRRVVSMPLTQIDWASGSLRQAVLTHPACPQDILYLAVNTWSIKEASIAANNPAATDETRVAALLRGIPLARTLDRDSPVAAETA